MEATMVTLKNILKTGLITAFVIILFEITNLLYIYKYFKFDYYLTAVAAIAMAAGVIINKKYIEPDCKTVDECNPISLLTPKEYEILVLICEGKTNKEIAAVNFVELSTIKTHINNLYNKLDVKKRQAAIELYQKNLNN